MAGFYLPRQRHSAAMRHVSNGYGLLCGAKAIAFFRGTFVPFYLRKPRASIYGRVDGCRPFSAARRLTRTMVSRPHRSATCRA